MIRLAKPGRAATIFLGLIAASCSTPPDPGSESVRMGANSDFVRGCQFLGQATVGASSMPIDVTRENAITNMRNRAVEMGGNAVVTPGPAVSMPGPTATMTGDVYRCGA